MDIFQTAVIWILGLSLCATGLWRNA